MKIAQDTEGKSIRPFKSGQGICPVCKTAVRAHCGDIYQYHWHHKEDAHCDYYWETETNWHRKWKSFFPENCVEVIMTKNGKTHIADVQTVSGLVIEFQNSSISPHTIRVREDFYERMIWVVNAESFKDNFKIRSVVKSELKELVRNFNWKKKNVAIPAEYNENIKHYEKETKKNYNEINRQEYNLQSNLVELEKINESLKTIDELSVKIIGMIMSNDYLFDSHIREIADALDDKYKNFFKDTRVELETLKKKVIEYQGKIQYFKKLKTYDYNRTIYCLVDYQVLKYAPEEQLKNVIAIKKETAYNLFTDVTTFPTINSYINFEFTARNYLIAFNPAVVLTRFNKTITEAENEIYQLETQIHIVKNSLKSDLETLLSKWQKELIDQTTQIKIQLSHLKTRKVSLEENLSIARIAKENEEQRERDRIEKNYNSKRYEIMRENKGKYTFSWKKERKSWQAAKCTLYFDIGEDCLFKKVYDEEFEKIKINDFLARYTK